MRVDPMVEFFGEPIFTYTRKQAIEDGSQVDLSLSDTAKEAGFKYPVYMTRRVWDTCVEVPDGHPGQDLDGRLWDVLFLLKMAIRRSTGDRVDYTVKVVTANGTRNQNLLAVVGAKDIDDPAPSITIMYPDED